MSALVEKLRSFWHDQIPPWIPLALAVLGGAFWVGQQQQSIIDRLNSVESQIKAIQDYLRTEHQKAYVPGVSSNQPQDAGIPLNP